MFEERVQQLEGQWQVTLEQMHETIEKSAVTCRATLQKLQEEVVTDSKERLQRVSYVEKVVTHSLSLGVTASSKKRRSMFMNTCVERECWLVHSTNRLRSRLWMHFRAAKITLPLYLALGPAKDNAQRLCSPNCPNDI